MAREFWLRLSTIVLVFMATPASADKTERDKAAEDKFVAVWKEKGRFVQADGAYELLGSAIQDRTFERMILLTKNKDGTTQAVSILTDVDFEIRTDGTMRLTVGTLEQHTADKAATAVRQQVEIAAPKYAAK